MGEFRFSSPGLEVEDYTATGTEGNKISAPYLLGKTIALVTRNTLTLIPENTNPPDSQGWFYDSDPASPTFQDLIFGTNLQPDEVIQILYV